MRWCCNGLFLTAKELKSKSQTQFSKMTKMTKSVVQNIFWEYQHCSTVAKPNCQCSKHVQQQQNKNKTPLFPKSQTKNKNTLFRKFDITKSKRFMLIFLVSLSPPNLGGERLPALGLRGTFANKWLNINFH